MSKKATARAARPHKSKSAKTATEACVICGETLDISQAVELHSRLMDALAMRRAITLDTSAVERADTAALQVLCAFVCDARAENIAVTWRQPSEVFCHTARLLGLDEFLGLQPAS